MTQDITVLPLAGDCEPWPLGRSQRSPAAIGYAILTTTQPPLPPTALSALPCAAAAFAPRSHRRGGAVCGLPVAVFGGAAFEAAAPAGRVAPAPAGREAPAAPALACAFSAAAPALAEDRLALPPTSHWPTWLAKRSEQSVSCALSASGATCAASAAREGDTGEVTCATHGAQGQQCT